MRRRVLYATMLELKFVKDFSDGHGCYARESGHPGVFEIPGFRLALATPAWPE